jgi:hypothetical protein
LRHFTTIPKEPKFMPPRVGDPSIGDDEVLWRRIIPQWVYQMPNGESRPSSAAFLDNYTGEVSVHLAALTDVHRVLAGRPNDRLAAILAGFPRSLGHVIACDPTENDPSHTLICPPPHKSKSQRKSDARKIAEQVRWVPLLATPSE